MKKSIILSLILFLGATALLNAQEAEDWSFPVKFSGQKPVISDFVSAILNQEELGESLGDMKVKWKLYRAGKALPEGNSILVDTKNGYARYETTDKYEDGEVYGNSIEFCYWNCSDSRYKLVAYATVCTHNGKTFMGQYSGICFYYYDSTRRRMENTSTYDLGIDVDMPDDTNLFVHKLPQTGKTIECDYFAPSGNVVSRLTWNGSKFVKEK